MRSTSLSSRASAWPVGGGVGTNLGSGRASADKVDLRAAAGGRCAAPDSRDTGAFAGTGCTMSPSLPQRRPVITPAASNERDDRFENDRHRTASDAAVKPPQPEKRDP